MSGMPNLPKPPRIKPKPPLPPTRVKPGASKASASAAKRAGSLSDAVHHHAAPPKPSGPPPAASPPKAPHPLQVGAIGYKPSAVRQAPGGGGGGGRGRRNKPLPTIAGAGEAAPAPAAAATGVGEGGREPHVTYEPALAMGVGSERDSADVQMLAALLGKDKAAAAEVIQATERTMRRRPSRIRQAAATIHTTTTRATSPGAGTHDGGDTNAAASSSSSSSSPLSSSLDGVRMLPRRSSPTPQPSSPPKRIGGSLRGLHTRKITKLLVRVAFPDTFPFRVKGFQMHRSDTIGDAVKAITATLDAPLRPGPDGAAFGLAVDVDSGHVYEEEFLASPSYPHLPMDQPLHFFAYIFERSEVLHWKQLLEASPSDQPLAALHAVDPDIMSDRDLATATAKALQQQVLLLARKLQVAREEADFLRDKVADLGGAPIPQDKATRKVVGRKLKSGLSNLKRTLRGNKGNHGSHSSSSRHAVRPDGAAEDEDVADVSMFWHKKKKRVKVNTGRIQVNERLTEDVGGSLAKLYICTVDGWQCVMKELDVGFAKQLSGDLLIAFETEASFLCRYLFHDFHEGRLRLFMTKYACSLRDVIQERRALLDAGKEEEAFLSLSLLTDFFAQIANGLAFLAEHGIMHRDLKAANIFCMQNALGKIKHLVIGDFDTAKQMTRNQETKDIVGTPGYIAPEVWSKKGEFSHPADIYSFGMIMYELMTLYRPFEGLRGAQIQDLLQEGEIPAELMSPQLQRRYKQLPQLCKHCLTLDPQDRPNVPYILHFLQSIQVDA